MTKLVFLPLALVLGGCSSIGFFERNTVSRADTIPVVAAAPATVGTIPVAAAPQVDPAAAEARAIAALLLPEGAGNITKIREKNFVNGTRQEIVIAADKGTYGENVIDVSIRTAAPGAKHVNPMQIGPPSESGIRNEILSRFPDVQMNIVTRPMRNALGPYGLAIGRHPGGSRCIFAWQWIDDLRDGAPGSNLTKLNAMMAGRQLATSVRIRLCRSDATVDQLAGHIEGLRIASPSALERIASLDRRDIEAGEVVAVGRGGGSGSRSAGNGLLKPVSGSLEAAIARPARNTQVASAPKPQPQRRRVARAPREQRPPQQQAAPQQAPVYAAPPVQQPAPNYGGGQRYLAPVAGAAPVYGAPAPVAAAPGAGMGLPPQAYRGPSY